MAGPKERWGYADAAHLFRRAAFGARPSEIERAATAGLDATVDALLAPREGAAGDEPPARLTFAGLVEWWSGRMLRTPYPLEERMTFFWHNHFATSIATVRHAELMLQQNKLFRAHALGNVRELTTAVARDPAMLLWLDNYLNRKEHPNENFGRELLELFTLGLNQYGEADVMASARAFTGWTLTDETSAARFAFSSAAHDGGGKTFLSHTGAWNGEDIVRIACSERAHARFLAGKLFAWFAYDDPSEELVDRLASVYLRHEGETRPLVRAILTSPEMYSGRALWSKIKSPIDHAVMTCRMLSIDADPAAIAEVMTRQGLMLFSPPDVGGWHGGMSWINSWSLLTRLELAGAVAAAFDPAVVAGGRRFSSADEMIDFYLRLSGPLELQANVKQRLRSYVAPGGILPDGEALVQRQRGLVRIILSLPEWQRN